MYFLRSLSHNSEQLFLENLLAFFSKLSTSQNSFLKGRELPHEISRPTLVTKIFE